MKILRLRKMNCLCLNILLIGAFLLIIYFFAVSPIIKEPSSTTIMENPQSEEFYFKQRILHSRLQFLEAQMIVPPGDSLHQALKKSESKFVNHNEEIQNQRFHYMQLSIGPAPSSHELQNHELPSLQYVVPPIPPHTNHNQESKMDDDSPREVLLNHQKKTEPHIFQPPLLEPFAARQLKPHLNPQPEESFNGPANPGLKYEHSPAADSQPPPFVSSSSPSAHMLELERTLRATRDKFRHDWLDWLRTSHQTRLRGEELFYHSEKVLAQASESNSVLAALEASAATAAENDDYLLYSPEYADAQPTLVAFCCIKFWRFFCLQFATLFSG